MDIRFIGVKLSLIICVFLSQADAKGTIRDFRQFSCQNKVQPSSVEYLREFAPHLLMHALDIDFIVKETGLCTSMLIALMEFQSGIVRNTGNWRTEAKYPFAELSDEIGFLPQLIDVAAKINKARTEVYQRWIPVKQPFAFLFDHSFPPGTPPRFSQEHKKLLFQRLYRGMFMQEFYALVPANPHDRQVVARTWTTMRIHGWQFLRRYSSTDY